MMQKEIDELKAENRALKQRFEEMKKSQEIKGVFGNVINKDALIAALQDQHQQDYIRINDLTTTIHVLSGLYSNLRKTVGMD